MKQGEQYRHGPAASFWDFNLFFLTILVKSNAYWIDDTEREDDIFIDVCILAVIGKIICYVSGG